ncbi:MAG TPA: class I SAM-dependent methyltransferase [Solirubrobacteraceae bacterium]|jgi:SAM-dependent methyltransferase|nr:class I SAM-dependent methyltransferase [Solirubrobacteraceae bacterium]
MSTQLEVPEDWYRSAYPPEMAKLPWADKTVSEVDRAITMLKPVGGERVLDLGCGTGRHTLELTRRGFSVVGVELLEANVKVAEADAQAQSLNAEFIQADLRELELSEEFDIVITFNDGGIGYFESDAENLRTFEVIARALKGSGRHLGQTPNVMFAEKHLPEKTWILGSEAVELTDHRWNSRARRMEGSAASIRFGEVLEKLDPIPYSSRLYTVDELKDIYASVGMTLTNTFRGSGKAGRPRDTQYEIFWEARKG